MRKREFVPLVRTAPMLRLFTLMAVFSLVLAGILHQPKGHAQVLQNPTVESAANAELNGGRTNGALAIPNRNLIEMVRDGGVLMIPILGSSFIMMAFCFERVLMLRRGRVIPRPFVKRILEQIRESQLGREEALALCEQNGSPVARVFAAALRKWGRPAVEVEQAAIDSGERVAYELRRYLLVFHGVSTVAPLLGLLGTVLGMIECFNVIAQANSVGRPDLLAGGISQALLTTAAGLSVAIPALCVYLYFSGRADRLLMDIDSLGEEIVGLISAERGSGEGRKKTTRSAA